MGCLDLYGQLRPSPPVCLAFPHHAPDASIQGGQAVIYDLAMPREQFDGMDRTVRAVLANSRMESRQLRTITADSALLSADNRGYIDANPTSLAVCFGTADGNHEFDIWTSPAYTDTDTAFYVDTILHELSHGYFGAYIHNHKWKRLFGRVLYHYSYLVDPIDADDLVTTMLRRYTLQHGAETNAQFKDRLAMEKDSLAKAAVAEREFIARSYYWLGAREAISA